MSKATKRPEYDKLSPQDYVQLATDALIRKGSSDIAELLQPKSSSLLEIKEGKKKIKGEYASELTAHMSANQFNSNHYYEIEEIALKVIEYESNKAKKPFIEALLGI